MNNNCIVFFFGAPGAGKGVSAQILKEEYNFKHLSMGEYLRGKVLAQDSDIIPYKDLIENGRKLIHCAVVNKIYATFADLQDKYNCVIDGYPRTHNQLKFLEKYYDKKKNKEMYFILLEADDELLLSRLISRKTCSQCSHDYIFETVNNDGYCNLCNGKLYKRATDTEATIKDRIRIFNNTTRKIFSEIEKRHQTYHIDANMDIHIIYKEVLNIVNR